MQLPERLWIIHQPNRLRVMALLHERGDVSVTAARRTLDMTAGNLDAHIRRLQGAGLLEHRRALLSNGFEVRVRITKEGAAAFRDYLDHLQRFVQQASQ